MSEEQTKEIQGRVPFLLVVSDPLDPNLTPLVSRKELHRLYSTLKSANLPFALIQLNPPTLAKLHSAVLSQPLSILHFVGHGNTDGIWLETERGRADFVTSADLAAFISQSSVSLVFLNVCDSWGPAQALADAGVQAVIASKRPILDELASDIASTVYSAVIGGHTISESVASAHRIASRTLGAVGNDLLIALGRGVDKAMPLPDMGRNQNLWAPSRASVSGLDLSLIDHFVDRWQELTGPIYDFFDSPDGRAMALIGIGGVGKSSLATAAGWRYGWKFCDGVVCITPRGNPEFGLHDLLRELDTKLPSWHIGTGKRHVRTERTLERMARSQILLILDNLDPITPENRREIADFLAQWDTSWGGRALLTMREHIPEFDPIVSNAVVHIDSLDPSSATELFRQLTDRKTRPSKFREEDRRAIARSAHYHPLLLNLTAKFLNHGGTWPEAERSLASMSGVYDSLRLTLENMLKQLSHRHATIPYLLKTWSVFRAGATSDAWEAVTVPCIPPSSLPLQQSKVEDGIRLLRQAGLFTRTEEERYHVHALVSQFLEIHVWSALPELEREQICRNHIRFFVQYAGDATGRTASKLALLDPEYLNIRFALQTACRLEEWGAVKQLAENFYKYLDVRGYWDEWEDFVERVALAARKTDDLESEARAVYYKAEILERRGYYKEAKEHLEQAREKAAKVNVRDLLARILGIQGRVLRLEGHFDEARRKYDESILQLEAIGDIGRCAALYREMARCAFDQGRLEDMRRYATESYRLEKYELDGNRAWGVADSEMKLAQLAILEDDLENARQLLASALPVVRDADKSLRLYAEALHLLAVLEAKEGNITISRKHFREALDVAQSLGDIYRIRLIKKDLETYIKLGLDDLDTER